MLPRRPLLTLEAKTPWRPGMLLPGEADDMSKRELGARSRQQKIDRSVTRYVTFRMRIGTDKTVGVIASTDKQAVQRARWSAKIPKDWPAISVDNRPYQDS
jgi:hypothetical protein